MEGKKKKRRKRKEKKKRKERKEKRKKKKEKEKKKKKKNSHCIFFDRIDKSKYLEERMIRMVDSYFHNIFTKNLLKEIGVCFHVNTHSGSELVNQG